MVGKNYFCKITVDFNKKRVKRDNIQTTLIEEFGITEDEEKLAFSSIEEFEKLLKKSVFEFSVENQIYTIKNKYQTKKIFVEADKIEEVAEGEQVKKLKDGLYELSFYSEKLTLAMYNYYKNQSYIKNVYNDEIFLNTQINDESQTMYGGVEIDLKNHRSLGATTLGLDNYQKIISENLNANEIIIATIGYGFDVQNEFFTGRVLEEGYNFILNNKDINQSNSQGNRIAEILVDSSWENAKILPLVVISDEEYSTISSIAEALMYATRNADVICYELVHAQNAVIDKLIENAFEEEVPICAVSTPSEENYPANHKNTISVSSLNRVNEITEYSGKGDFVDFSMPSTDVSEVFNSNIYVSRWSGAQYANAQICAEIALIKTYNKQASIQEIYEFLKTFCIDLGEPGKDILYGNGMPNFSNITIADIDKTIPSINGIEYENETWELSKKVKIKAEDNIRITHWGITRNYDGPLQGEWQKIENITPTFDTTWEISENGDYYIWVKDSAENKISKEIKVEKIDNTPPEIAYSINTENIASGYVTINVTAEDKQSGLYNSPFSWDKITWTLENGSRNVTENGKYTAYAVDNLGNIGEKEILVDVFPQEGTYELGVGNIISSMKVSSDWNGNINNNVQIELNKDLDITAWQITQSSILPNNYIEVIPRNVENNTNNQNNSTMNTIIRDFNKKNTTKNNTVNNTNSIQSNNTIGEVSILKIASSTNILSPYTIYKLAENTETIKITKALSVDTTYFMWVRNSQGIWNYQTFIIHKAEIT